MTAALKSDNVDNGTANLAAEPVVPVLREPVAPEILKKAFVPIAYSHWKFVAPVPDQRALCAPI